MLRDLDALSGRTFDVLVVGGGIYGLAIAYDAAQRGLTVALIERGDFGGGASFNHLRTIHGGLRYLQTLDIRRARESVRERRTLASIAPHHVRPLPFALPLERSVLRGAAAMRAGFLLDRLVSWDRNRGVAASHVLPDGRVVTGPQFRQLDLGGGEEKTAVAVWHDYVTTEADRLTFAFAIAASHYGATLANYVEAVALRTYGGRVTGADARDRLGDRSFAIDARITVNATGGDVDRLLAPIRAATSIPMLRAMNFVTRREAGGIALGGRSSSGRHLFLVPWRGRALFGTWESARLSKPSSTNDESAFAAFIRELNRAFPPLHLSFEDVTLVHSGVVPAVLVDRRLSLAGGEQVIDHATIETRPLEGLVTVAGAKYTTARGVAERVTNQVVAKLGAKAAPCLTDLTPLPGGDLADVGTAIDEARRRHSKLAPDVVDHLVAAYGSRYSDVLTLCDGRPDLASRVSDRSPVIGAELIWAARAEMAVTLSDAVVRRTPLGALGYPGDPAVTRACALLAQECGWSSERQQSEVAALKRFYTDVLAFTPTSTR